MRVELPVETMTVAEKLEAMETLWASLSSQPGDLPAPEWHGQVLRERTERLDQGETQSLDWEDVKRDLDGQGA